MTFAPGPSTAAFPRAWTVMRQFAGSGRAPRRQFLPPEAVVKLLAGAEALLPVLDAPELPWALAEAVHDPAYLERWRSGAVTRAEERAMGFGWDAQIARRGRLSSGATLSATQDALTYGAGLHLGGGTHHAYEGHAEGFSFLNDVVIAAAWARTQGIGRVAVLDLDVHQGNGTAHMLEQHSWALPISLHAAGNYPFVKEPGGLNIELPGGTDDAAYLEALEALAFPALRSFQPDLLYYLAGADVLAGDQLGKLALTLEGVQTRDERVYALARELGVPHVTVMAGGYNHDPEQVVAARLNTLRAWLAAAPTAT
ncbi:histone deacetylase [Deinococcus sp. KNUC1210]|uniref:histone deacetylase family protein n=1 Tax=Deinococcus sp. KNUC1210 TaxID=2917691 RepID=UPI001EF087C2|nr:histone deacetylase [Deinococcus sp. KNUC1210]ULH15331.1 histone deacetylase [Deinococcus sp. KNUC1210]